MSLDVYLRQSATTYKATGTGPPNAVTKSSGIFVRKNGQTVEISEEEWHTLHPDREPVRVDLEPDIDLLYHNNITHNLVPMAKEAGIYEAVWRPEELGLKNAYELTHRLTHALTILVGNPARFKKLNPDNGWGSYEGLIEFITSYLGACMRHPDAEIHVWR